MKKVELLAPAGSFAALEAAISAGADAVYIGGARFGARAYADNLTEEEMIRAIDLVHLHGKKLYMTVNTLLKNKEMEEDLYDYMLPYYEAGLDGVIVQDFGVVSFFQKIFPLLPVHASTQMAVSGANAADFLKKAGITRVVPARELSLDEIYDIYKTTGMEIECFIHGAICYSYSGMCLMSSLIGGRSGNRGRCAGTCRLPYDLYENGKKLNGEASAYPLNMKDMCTIALLPEILAAGVVSLKIEGRMKRPEYTAGVVEIYRKYLDLLENDPKGYKVEKKDYQRLLDLFNRDGFNESYYKVRNGRDMMAVKNAKITEKHLVSRNALYDEIGKRHGSLPKIKVGGFASLSEEGASFTLFKNDISVTAYASGVQKAEKQPLTEDRIRTQLSKMGNTKFELTELAVFVEGNLFVPMTVLNELRREAVAALEREMLSGFRRSCGAYKKEKTATACERPDEGFWALPEKKEQLEQILGMHKEMGIYIPLQFLNDEKLVEKMKHLPNKYGLVFPYMLRKGELTEEIERVIHNSDFPIDRFLVRNLESAALLLEGGIAPASIVLDTSVYTLNEEAHDFWRKRGIQKDTISLELNGSELKHRDNGQSEMVIYGRVPMMITAQCLKKNFDRCNKNKASLILKDRKGKTFPVECACNPCYNVIYNSLPTSLLKDYKEVSSLGCASYRIHLTTENESETAEVVRAFYDVYVKGKKINENSLCETTRGHFKRGVE